jgi:multidrug efflux pump subunit AcrA (membrane-fusion protein)
LVPSVIVGLVVTAIAGLSLWYLIRGEPLLVQGEVDATRFDLAARVDGRVAEIPVERGQNVAAGAVLVKIDNPETIAKNEQALAAKVVADAQLANINVGTRAEVIAARKAAMERAEASVVLAQKTYDRTSEPCSALVDAALPYYELIHQLGIRLVRRRVPHYAAPLAPCPFIGLGRVRGAPNDGAERAAVAG